MQIKWIIKENMKIDNTQSGMKISNLSIKEVKFQMTRGCEANIKMPPSSRCWGGEVGCLGELVGSVAEEIHPVLLLYCKPTAVFPGHAIT